MSQHPPSPGADSTPDREVVVPSEPNLNLLGAGEPQIYGTETLDDHVATAVAVAECPGFSLEHLQSNHEGTPVDAVDALVARAASDA